MAPHVFPTLISLWQRRDAAAQSASDPVSGASSSGTGSTLYLGIGLGVGGAIVIAIVVVTVQILRKRAEHQRAADGLDNAGAQLQMRQHHDLGEVPRPVTGSRCGSFVPVYARSGWGELPPAEAIYQQQSFPNPAQRKRNAVPLPKRFKHRGIPLKRLKHFSAIAESPRSRNTPSPSQAAMGADQTPEKPFSEDKPCFRKTITLVHPAERGEDVFTAPGSPKPYVLPSFAIRSPGKYGAAIANDDRLKAPRSVSVGAIISVVLEQAFSVPTVRPFRPPMHTRSISLGAPPTMPPLRPVPPLPVALDRKNTDDSSHRQGMCITRHSSSSQASTSSSVLVASPIPALRDDGGKTMASPSVEQMVAEDESAELKSVVNRQWQDPRSIRPQPVEASLPQIHASTLPRTHASIRSNIAQYNSGESLVHRNYSTSSTASAESTRHRLSIPQIGTADRMSISRVSSFNSLHGSTGNGVQKVMTPRKACRQSSVSASGSPAERRKTSIAEPGSVLRNIQANAVANGNTPSRQASSATQNSGRSSNGNPFQWDQSLPLMKPSALKGSPNSKGSKGHRRQNCVRISTLTPQILGPPSSRPTSPGYMVGIQEEGDENSSPKESSDYFSTKTRYYSNLQRLSKASSESSLTRNLKVRTFRASLTPSSPTSSICNSYQEYNGASIPSQHSEDRLSASPTTRTASRQSDRSSAFTIPAFPSPSKATASISGVQRDRPVPEFYLSRPSTDDASPKSLDMSSHVDTNYSPPFALHMSSDEDFDRPGEEMLPSSPPLPEGGGTQEYDPAWPLVTMPELEPSWQEYDPASPPVWTNERTTELRRAQSNSSRYLPFAVPVGVQGSANSGDDSPVSPLSRPTSYGGELPDTPPISPKTISGGFSSFFNINRVVLEATPASRQTVRSLRSTEKLTSANASAIMATIPEVPPNVGFPTAVPILPPPKDATSQPTPARPDIQRTRSTVRNILDHGTPSTAQSDDDNVAPPSPLRIKHSPQGPRSEPGKSVLRNAMALRRMNSEIDTTDRSSRRYTRLAREPSPLLPWVGSPDFNESCHNGFGIRGGASVFDFGDLQTAAGAAAAEVHELQHQSALDDVDMFAFDRRLEGALAGFEAVPPSSADATATTSRASSVREDGEKFWEQQKVEQPVVSTDRRLASQSTTTPMKKATRSSAQEDRSLQVTPNSKMPVLTGSLNPTTAFPPLSITKTPRSLYDSDGFLRSSPRNSHVM
ncbi:hypothetical protein KC340_g7342 [Hortaea werneckii]|nr:hypothetical protein KC342_g7517 [Hortaea werneckii]KAI7100206.1 hypothetical protein KC339_g7635 [Hortaea werneckii]KAI7239024.1 hypothetical protein KC365_g4251 [Hortaea werneckii]KAI7321577.1 hypothetical protein KC340_g7342 [Hortaea werneckii]KAI7404463.1 hypothetical protein KC328_g1947 [Hortaea werneckii]